MKKILLICPLENDLKKKYEAYPSGALILIGTMLKNKGHDVKIVHMATDQIDSVRLKSIVDGFKPDVAGITMNTFQTKCSKDVTRLIKESNKNTLVVAGGPHPSALKTELFADFPCVDIAVVGEGENTFIEIVEGKELKDIKGLCYNGKENEPREREEDLDYIPLPNLDLVDLKKFVGADPVGAYPSMYIMASRGCPFQCTFCNKSIWGNKVRFRKPEHIIREIEWLNSRYGIKEIFFQDDTFNLNREWAEEIFNLIIENKLNKKIVFKTPFRANENLVDEKLLKLAKQAGFWMIFYGVESGNQEMLNRMKKNLTLAEIKRAFDLTHKAGIKTLGSFIIGMPGETEKTFNDTVQFWKVIRPYVTGCGLAMPFPNTEFDKTVSLKGQKLITDYDEYSLNKIIVRTDALDEKKLKELFKTFKNIILKYFFIDLFTFRYFRMILFALRSPRYLYHIFFRIKAYSK